MLQLQKGLKSQVQTFEQVLHIDKLHTASIIISLASDS